MNCARDDLFFQFEHDAFDTVVRDWDRNNNELMNICLIDFFEKL